MQYFNEQGSPNYFLFLLSPVIPEVLRGKKNEERSAGAPNLRKAAHNCKRADGRMEHHRQILFESWITTACI